MENRTITKALFMCTLIYITSNLEIIDFEESGHMILDEELGKAVCYINKMLDMVDHESFS